MIEISTYYKDNDTATVCSSATDYFIQYRKDGEVICTEAFSGKVYIM
jgi:hypothetical protein